MNRCLLYLDNSIDNGCTLFKSLAHYFCGHLVCRALLHRTPFHLPHRSRSAPRARENHSPKPIQDHGKEVVVRHYLAIIGTYSCFWIMARRGQQPVGQSMVSCKDGTSSGANHLSPKMRGYLFTAAKQHSKPFQPVATLLERGRYAISFQYRFYCHS